MFTQILSQGHHLLCRTKSNAVFYYIPKPPKQQGQGRPKRYGGRVHLPYLQYRDIIVKNKTLSVADKVVRTKMCPVDVRLVVIRTRPKKSKPYRYFCLFTSDQTVDELIQHYRNRWQIETTFRDVKQNLVLIHINIRKRKSLNRFAQLSFVAATLTQLIFTKTTTNTASETNIDEVPLDLEDVLLALNRHWYKAKYLTRGLMTAYLQRCFMATMFFYELRAETKLKEKLKIVEDST